MAVELDSVEVDNNSNNGDGAGNGGGGNGGVPAAINRVRRRRNLRPSSPRVAACEFVIVFTSALPLLLVVVVVVVCVCVCVLCVLRL